MARGYIYEVRSEPEFVGAMDESDFYDGAGYEFEFVKNEPKSESENLIGDLLRYLEKRGAEIDTDEETGATALRFDNDFKCSYFLERLEKLKRLVSEMTIEEFALDDSAIYDIKSLADDDFGDAVYLDGSFMTLDAFVRNAFPGKSYYIGSKVVFMH